MTKNFPPAALADLSRNSTAAYLSLITAMRKGPFSIVLGAGVSASAGLPPWTTLLRGIASAYFAHWDFDKQNKKSNDATPPKNLSIAFWQDFMWRDGARVAANELVSREDALLVAQMIKARVKPDDWIYLVRKILYGNKVLLSPSPLLKAISGLCLRLASKVEILSYNYDNLIEVALSDQKIPLTAVWEFDRVVAPGTIAIYYPHGYLKHGGGPKSSIVLGEDDYHHYAVEQYGWRNVVQLRQFSRATCLFVGFSLTDPQVRRLLWVAKRAGSGMHYALLPSATQKGDVATKIESLFDAQLRDVNVNVIRYPAGADGHDHRRLTELISLLDGAFDNGEVLWS